MSDIVTSPTEVGAPEAPSRRDAVRIALAALAGMGMSLVGPSAAWAAGAGKSPGWPAPSPDQIRIAASGGNFILGGNAVTNDAGASTTSLTSSSIFYTADFGNTGTDGSVLFCNQETASASNAAYIRHIGGGGPTLLLESSGTGSPETGAHIRMVGHIVGSPATGMHAIGELYTDSNGVLYRCVASGIPGTWVPMTATVLLAAPKRVIDTRNGTGGISGALASGKVYTWNSFLATAGIPAKAVGLVGNLTMVAPSGQKLAGGAFMAIVPATKANGTSVPSSYPGVSTINAQVGSDAIANQFTVRFGVGTYAGKISIVKSGSMALHAVVDVASYII